MRKLLIALIAILVSFAGSAADASSGPDHRLPTEIDLPDGFFPEGIAIGRGSTFYVGSLADGSVYRGDLETGQGSVLTEPTGPFSAVGLAVDRWQRVWVAGGPSGTGRVYDGRTGELLASYELTGPVESFINDVIVTRQAAWFTDSGTTIDPDPGQGRFPGEPRVFEVPLGRRGGLPDPSEVTEIAVDVPDVGFPNLNGIETTPGNHNLVVAHTLLGDLFAVDKKSGSAQRMEVDVSFAGADGLVRNGRTLYVVENGAAQITELQVNKRATAGEVRRVLPLPATETPTTAALYRRGLYVADARFMTRAGPYQILRVPLQCRSAAASGVGQGAPPQDGDPPGLIRTVATISGNSLLRGRTEAAFLITDPTPPELVFDGDLTFFTRTGTLTVTLDGTLDVTTGRFRASGPVTDATGGLHGAVGTISFDGVQDLADPAGAFTETLSGEVCVDGR